MWTTTIARCTLPTMLKRSSVLACHTLRAGGRPGWAAAISSSPSLHLAWRQLRGHGTQAPSPLPSNALGVSPGVRQVRALEQERLLEVEWEDSGQSLYPYTWLRDNCQCPLCTLQSAQARSLLLSQLDIHTGVDRVQVTDNNKVSIVWPDQHTSEFDPEWLRKRCFSPAARQALQEELFLNVDLTSDINNGSSHSPGQSTVCRGKSSGQGSNEGEMKAGAALQLRRD